MIFNLYHAETLFQIICGVSTSFTVVSVQWSMQGDRKERDPNLPDFTQLTLSKSEYKALPIEGGIGPQTPLAMSCLTTAQRGAIQCRTPADLEPYREYPALDLHLNLFARALCSTNQTLSPIAFIQTSIGSFLSNSTTIT